MYNWSNDDWSFAVEQYVKLRKGEISLNEAAKEILSIYNSLYSKGDKKYIGPFKTDDLISRGETKLKENMNMDDDIGDIGDVIDEDIDIATALTQGVQKAKIDRETRKRAQNAAVKKDPKKEKLAAALKKSLTPAEIASTQKDLGLNK